jgi:hypothetical protein
MTGTLFGKECKKIAKSLTYLIYVALFIGFIYSQLGPEITPLERPQPGQASYGMKPGNNPEQLMKAAAASLYGEFEINAYTAYPLGFYKNVKLNEARQTAMADILAELTGLTRQELSAAVASDTEPTEGIPINSNVQPSDGIPVTGGEVEGDAKAYSISGPPPPPVVPVNPNLAYDRFLGLMQQADKLIGGGSHYGKDYLPDLAQEPMTYADAVLAYTDIVEKDRITGAYARLFADYSGIVLAFVPVFVAVAIGLKDRRSRMQELIFVRKLSSVKLQFTRYGALITMLSIPVVLAAGYFTAWVIGEHPGYALDPFAFLKYTVGWLLPTLMTSTAVGVFLTELTATPLAIAVQGVWWFLGLLAGAPRMEGGYGTDLALRHNIVGNTQVFLDHIDLLIYNRVAYACFALVLVLAAAYVYHWKRRGRWHAAIGFNALRLHRKNPASA